MKIVIASDSFKECLAAHEVCAAIAEGVRRADASAQIVEVPMADGGQGTVEALVRATRGEFREAEVTGPLGERVAARFGLLGDGKTAVIEMAAASGLELVSRDKRDPLRSTTFGTGELIRHALDAGVGKILIGIGGSATNDGGAGMAQALGYRLLDDQGNDLAPGGGALAKLASIDASGRDSRLDQIEVEVACDVTNPLTGEQGASAVYGPQKGATAEMVSQLDANLARLAEILRRDLGKDVEQAPGSGAAGGLGGGLLAFCNANLRRGVHLVIETVRLEQALHGADLCITGEGALDHSSQFGKTAVGVAGVCKQLGIPAVALAGAVKPEARPVLDMGVTAYIDITQRPCTLEEAFASARTWLADAAEQVVRLFQSRR